MFRGYPKELGIPGNIKLPKAKKPGNQKNLRAKNVGNVTLPSPTVGKIKK